MGLFGGGNGDDVEIKIELTGAEEATKKAETLSRSVEDLGKTAERSGSGFTDLQAKIITANEAIELGQKVASALIGTLKFTAGAVIELAEAGDKLGDLEEGFEALGGSSKAIELASGRINDILPNIDLLRLANKAMVAGIPEVNKNFGDIAEYGRKVADTLGVDATQGIEQLTQALVSGRSVALKQLGIMVDSDKANQDYAKSMGIVGRELSELEKKSAVTAQALEQMRQNLGKMPETGDSVQDALDAIKAKFTNLIGETGKAINENDDLTIALRTLANTIGKIDVKELAKDIAFLTSKFVDGVTAVLNWAEGLRKAWKEAQARNKGIEDTAKATEKETRARLELELIMEEERLAYKQELKNLKDEADTRDKVTKGIEDNARAQKEAEKERLAAINKSIQALSGLKERLADLRAGNEQGKIESDLEIAIGQGNEEWANDLQDQLRQNVREGIARGYEDAGGDLSNPEALQAIDEQTDIIVEGAVSKAEEKRLQKLAEQLRVGTSLMENALADAIIRGFEGGFSRVDFKEWGASLGQAVGSVYGGPVGGAVGGIVGNRVAEDFSKFGTSSENTVDAIGTYVDTIFFGAGTALATAVNAAIGGSTTPNEDALVGLDRWIEEKLASAQESGTGTALDLTNIETGSFMGGGNWSDDFWASFDDRAVTSFSGLGEGLTQIAGVTEDVGGQLGYILANNLNGNLDQARMLLIEMGIGAQDLEEAFLSIGLTGEQSWHTVETYMQSIGDLTGEGLVGIGDLEGAMNQFINSGGRGQEALISLRNIGIEGMEAGAESMDALRGHLVGLNKFTAEQINSLMSAFGQRGIDALQEIKDASDRTLGGVTADAESLGFAWSDSIGQGLADSIDDVEKLKSVISDLPDTIEKNITLKVKTEYSGDDAKALYSDLRNNVGVARA